MKKKNPDMMMRALAPMMSELCRKLDFVAKQSGLRYMYKDGKHMMITEKGQEYLIKV